MGSPHFDPAVVAVSSSLPHGPINQFDHHQVRNAGNAYTITTPAPQHISAPQQQHTSAPQQQRISAPQQQHISVPQQQQHIPMSNGIGNRVEVGYNQQPIMPLIDDKINEWNASDAHQHLNGNYQQDDRSGSDDNEGKTLNSLNKFNVCTLHINFLWLKLYLFFNLNKLTELIKFIRGKLQQPV